MSWWVLAGIRAWLLVGLVGKGNLILAGLEVLALGFGAWNARVAERRFTTPAGVWVALCYAAGVWILPPAGALSVVGWVLALLGLSLSTWALLCLRGRFSIAATSWVGLCDWGPYQWVRHPQLTARLLLVSAIWVQVQDVGDGLRCLLACALTWSVICAEEAELCNVPAWRAYRNRVRFRCVPGVV